MIKMTIEKRILEVLCLEDSYKDAEIIREILSFADYNLEMKIVSNEPEFISALQNYSYDIVLADYKLPGFESPAALQWLNKISPDTPFICISGAVGEDIAVELLKKGAVDYVLKDRMARLPFAVQRALDEAKEKKLRLQAEIDLHKSEERYLTLVNYLPDPMYVHVDSKITLVNPAFCQLLGAENPLQLIGKSVLEIVHPQYHKQVLERWDLVFNELMAPLLAEKFVRLDGTFVDVEVNAVAIDWKGLKGVQVIARDITQRKLTEEALMESQSHYHSFIEQLPNPVFRKDKEGRYVLVNSHYCKLKGLNKEDFIGKKLREIVKGQIEKKGEEGQAFKYAKEGEDYHELIMRTGKPYETDEEYLEVTGEKQYMHVIRIPVFDLNGSVIGSQGIMFDVTVRKRAEKELIEAKVKAEELSIAKSNFMANMSHELRTPLVGILGISELMMTEAEDENKDNAKNIHESGLRLLKTITEILDFSKLESEKITVKLSVINLTQVISEEIRLNKKTADQKGLSIIESFSMEAVPIRSDEKLLRAIIYNIINNAVKFTFIGSITVFLGKTYSDIIIKVSDTGIGIPKEKYELIFEEFRQLSEGIGRSFEGNGLGLTVVKKYVQLLNGSINVESELNSGSTFTVHLPFIQDENKTILQDKSEFSTDKLVPLQEKQIYKLLIVDDDDINILTVRKMLEKDYYVIPVSSGLNALEEMKKQKIDIILMDINLKHGISGIEASQLIRKIEGCEKIPIVAMTAYAMPGDRKEFLQAGCSHYLAKPFSKKDILKLLDNIKSSGK
jgi:PAS domain S-box-containing protein